MGRFAPSNPFDPSCYISLYRDASNAPRYGARWKALFVTEPGSLTGQPVRDHSGEEMEFHSMRDAVEHLVVRHGAVRGDIVRVFLPRYEGKTGFHAVPDNAFPSTL